MKTVWVNLASFMPASTLDDNGEFWVQGIELSRTAKRVKVQCDTRAAEPCFYAWHNVKERI